jgi:hypothetical protein
MSTVNRSIIDDGLILYLDAANPKSYVSGSTTWTDISKNRNDGTLTNSPTYNSANNGSIVFDGVDDYFITPAGLAPSLNITSQITLETWFKSTSLANNLHGDGLFSKGLSTDGNSGVYELVLVNNTTANRPYFRLRIDSSTLVYSPSDILINLNQIYHIVCTYDGTIMRIFVNGIESGSGLSASGTIENNTQQLTIGVRYHGRNMVTDLYFSGNIYLSKIYNRALSATEIQQNYQILLPRFI